MKNDKDKIHTNRPYLAKATYFYHQVETSSRAITHQYRNLCSLVGADIKKSWGVEIHLYSRLYGESLVRHSWFEPISTRPGWGSPLHA